MGWRIPSFLASGPDPSWEGPLPSASEFIALTQPGEVPHCQCCGSTGVTLNAVPLDNPANKNLMVKLDLAPLQILCNICNIGPAGRSSEYPDTKGINTILKAISVAANEIIKESRNK